MTLYTYALRRARRRVRAVEARARAEAAGYVFREPWALQQRGTRSILAGASTTATLTADVLKALRDAPIRPRDEKIVVTPAEYQRIREAHDREQAARPLAFEQLAFEQFAAMQKSGEKATIHFTRSPR